MRRRTEGIEVDGSSEAHDQLAIDAIVHAAVAGYDRGKVVELVRALNPGREEATEGRDERGEEAEQERVQLDGVELRRGRGER